MRSRLTAPAALLCIAGLSVLVGSVATSRADTAHPVASATASAITIVIPGQADVSSPAVASAPNAPPLAGGVFSYPADGSIAFAQSSTALAATSVAKNAAARAESDVTSLSLFGAEISADAVTARTSAGTGYSGAGGNANGSTVINLKVLGQPINGSTASVGDWGQLTIGGQVVDQSAKSGVRGFRIVVTELDLRVTAAHGGLPAGSEIRIGSSESRVETAPAAQPATATTTGTTPPPAGTSVEPSVGDPPRDWPGRNGAGTVKPQPLSVHPKLTAGRYVFPVYGPSSYIDTYGGPRADVTYHHGDDIFGQLGQPLVAVADGTVFSVGWNKVGGNRLWLLDGQGNQFYYAHLSAFSGVARNGARVKAGEVVGFMGNTGDAQGTPYHVHFEVQPVAFLYLGYDGAVDPTSYVDAWSHQQDLPFPIASPWTPNAVPGQPGQPGSGAILLGVNDISTAKGHDFGSLRTAMAPPSAASLLQSRLAPSSLTSGDVTRSSR